ncbi:MAG: CHAT domain-containing protein [Anaerolineales bacterium]|nr:CHAT domain-containing protein [Anaerolineales bacterium]
MNYLPFDLFAGHRAAAGYPVRAECHLGQVPATGQPEPVSAFDVSDAAVQTALAAVQRGRTEAADLQALGERLAAAILPGAIRDLLLQARGAAAAQPGGGLRLRLRLAPAELNALPWELLWLPGEAAPLCVSTETVLARFLSLPVPVRALEAPRPLRILGVAPRAPGIDLEGHKAALNAAVAAASQRASAEGGPPVVLEWLEGIVTRERVRGALNAAETHIVHFIGHGSLSEGQPRLHLNDEQGDDFPASAATVAGFFRNRESARLVVLNACQGAAGDSAEALLGLAPQIAAQGVPAVVAMQWDIYDWAAQKLTTVFYQSLCSGPEAGEVETALTRARAVLFDDAPDSRAFATPVLLLRAEGERLWAAGVAAAPEKEPEAGKAGAATARAQTQTGSGNIQLGDHAHVAGDVFTGGKRVVNTGGGAYYAGPIDVGGSFVGGNQTISQHAGGDIVGRDKLTTTAGADALQTQALIEQFRQIQRQIDARPPDPNVDPAELKDLVRRIETEAHKSEQANPVPLERWLGNLGDLAADIFVATTSTLTNPGFGLAQVVQRVAAKVKQAREKRGGQG